MDSSDFIKGSFESKHGNLVLKVDMDELIALDPHARHRHDHTEMVCPSCKAEKRRQGNPYYSKQKLYIYDDSGIGFCQRCRTVYVPHFEPNPDKVILRLPNFNLTNEDTFDEVDSIPAVYNDGINFYLDADPINESIRNFYQKRRSDAVLKYMDTDLKFKYYNEEEIIVPFFWDGEPFFYQISYCHPVDLKYKTPPVKHKPIYCLRPGRRVVVLCEGIFDAIACLDIYPTCTIAALLGCDVTPYQVWMLRKLMPSQIIVYMDETELSLGIIDKLRTYPIADYCNFSYVESPNGEDPEEYLCRITNKIIVK